MSLGELAQYIEENQSIFSTELPYRFTKNSSREINYGKLMILMEGCPYALCIPGIFADFIQNNDDYTLEL